MKRVLHVWTERNPDGWLVATGPGMHGCHTQARTMEELLKRVREAAALCREVSG